MSFLETIYLFLIRWDIPIYFIAFVGIVLNLIRFWQSRGRLRRAMFGFERETGTALRTSALVGLLFFSAVAGAVYYVNTSIAPTLPAELLRPPTPAPNIFATPLVSPTPLTAGSPGTLRPRVTPNLVATATLPGAGQPAAPTSTRPPAQPAPASGFIPEGGGCTPAVHISEPRPNTTVFGTVEFIGSASGNDFGAFTLEMRGPGTGETWVDVLGGRSFIPVTGGSLGAVNLAVLDNGLYGVRVTVLDLNGLPAARCTIQLTVNNE